MATDFSETSTPINHHYITSHSRRPFIHRRAKFRSHTPTGTWTDFSDGEICGFGRDVDDYWSFIECNILSTCNIYRRFEKHFIVKWQIREFLRNLYNIWFVLNTSPAEAPSSRVFNMSHLMSTSCTIPFSLKWRCRFVRCWCYDIAFTVHSYCSAIQLISFSSHLFFLICRQYRIVRMVEEWKGKFLYTYCRN
jgi:hypothetical protein